MENSKRLVPEFVDVLRDCHATQKTKTAELLLLLSEGNVDSSNLLEGDVPMFINKSVTEIGKISFANKKRIEINSWDDNFASCASNRQRVKSKVGRVINKIFISSFLDEFYEGKMNNDVEVFTSQIKARFKGVQDHNFDMNTDFYKYGYEYTSSDAQDGYGSLGDSCMRHDECINDGYFDIYESCDTPVQLISHDDGDGIDGRALLWSLPEGKFLDRIYETHDGDMDKFKSLAKRNGWIFKARQSYNQKLSWVKNGETKDIPLIFPVVDLDEVSNFPYMDTFSYGFKDGDCSFLTNSREYAHEKLGILKFRVFECTGGGYSTSRGVEIYDVNDSLTTFKRVCFDRNRDFYSVNCNSAKYSPILSFITDDELESRNYRSHDEKGYQQIFSYLHEGIRYYFHKSECVRCEYSATYYPKVFVKLKMISWSGNTPKLANPKCFIKDYRGVLQPKSDCRIIFDKYDNQKIANRHYVALVTDKFGLNRIKDECIYIGGRFEGYLHKKEASLIKMAQRRVGQAKFKNDNLDLNILKIN